MENSTNEDNIPVIFSYNIERITKDESDEQFRKINSFLNDVYTVVLLKVGGIFSIIVRNQ